MQKINPQRISIADRHFFFGYYDKTPYHINMDRVLSMETDVYGRLPRSGESIDVGFFQRKGTEWQWHELAKTKSWNFQQGCMLQWLDAENMIYNSYEQDRLKAVVVGIDGRRNAELELPIYSVSNNKKFAMSVSFGLLQEHRRGYGYELPLLQPEGREQGIVKIDMHSGCAVEIISYQYFIEQGFIAAGDSYWIDHILHSPDDVSMAFLLRHIASDGATCSRVFIAKNDGSDIHCLLDTGMASHACWYDNKHFTIWGRKNTLTKSLQESQSGRWLKPLYDLVRAVGVPDFFRSKIYGDAFLKFNIKDYQCEVFGRNIPSNRGGGHYTFYGDWMLCDVMADAKGLRELFLYHIKKDKHITIDWLYSPTELLASGFRCDLHPRWSPDGKCVIVDSVHEGYRGLYAYDVAALMV